MCKINRSSETNRWWSEYPLADRLINPRVFALQVTDRVLAAKTRVREKKKIRRDKQSAGYLGVG